MAECTIEDAKKLHCPLGRHHFSTSTDMCSANRWRTKSGAPQHTRCLGDQCMLWVRLKDGFGKCGAV